jgi:hypothetical protein
MRLTLFLGVLMVSCWLLPAARAAEPDPLPTADELRKLYADGDYKVLLQKFPRVLALKGPAARGYDMVELNLLKADTFIQLKQPAPATTAVNDAIRAITDETDAKLAAKARAQQILMKQSPGLTYKPKAGTAGPIPLADSARRPEAYTALLADMQADVNRRIKAATGAKSLPPIITAVQGLTDMGVVELTATGSDAASKKAADDLAGGAQKLMADSVATLSKRQRDIDKRAGELIEIREAPRGEDRPRVGRNILEKRYRKRGITGEDRAELKDIIETCKKVESAAAEFEAVSKTQAAGFKQVAKDAGVVAEEADVTLKADYLSEVVPR